jgi:ABC-type amino acid transport system permease subunit
MRNIYAGAAIIGFLISISLIGLFAVEYGLNLGLFFQQLFNNYVSTLFALDLIVSSVVFWFFLFKEARKHQIKKAWFFVVLNLLIGLCFALPLFLYIREARIEKIK